MDDYSRRNFLTTLTAAGATILAGCSGTSENAESDPEYQTIRVEDGEKILMFENGFVNEKLEDCERAVGVSLEYEDGALEVNYPPAQENISEIREENGFEYPLGEHSGEEVYRVFFAEEFGDDEAVIRTGLTPGDFTEERHSLDSIEDVDDSIRNNTETCDW
jgi:hypothetical protein